ncbi:MAG TPA: NUDIX hydrolase [Candidatus Obscuribacterales bacterium]
MPQKHGPWTIQEKSLKYQDSFITVSEDQVIRPDGQPAMYATVAMKPGVAVLPIHSNDEVYLTKQFRYALGKESIEVVCGAIEEDEPPLTAAQREVQEEVGIKAEEWVDLGLFDIDTSIVHCSVHMFLAKQLTFIKANQEGTETIETVCVPFKEAVRMVMDSIITHSPSCVLILKARNILTD